MVLVATRTASRSQESMGLVDYQVTANGLVSTVFVCTAYETSFRHMRKLVVWRG